MKRYDPDHNGEMVEYDPQGRDLDWVGKYVLYADVVYMKQELERYYQALLDIRDSTYQSAIMCRAIAHDAIGQQGVATPVYEDILRRAGLKKSGGCEDETG